MFYFTVYLNYKFFILGINIIFMKAVLLLILLVFTAGCIGSDWFGQSVLKIGENRYENVVDVLVIEDKMTSPDSPLPPGMPLNLIFVLKNMDASSTIRDVKVDLFDAPGFDDSKVLEPNQCGKSDPCNILPGESKFISFDLKAPSYDKIAGLERDIDLNFRIEYKFTAYTYYEAIIADMNEIRKRQMEGETLKLDRKYVIGPGPIRIEAETGRMPSEKPNVISGTPYESVFAFVITDKGKGSLKDLSISDMTITFPDELPNPRPASEEYFSCSENICESKKIEDDNAEIIELYKGKSIPLLFYVPGIKKIDAPHINVPIDIKVDYTYDLRDSIRVKVKPLS